jgi:hypothetical protein
VFVLLSQKSLRLLAKKSRLGNHMNVSKDEIRVTLPITVKMTEGSRKYLLGKLDLTSQLSESDLESIAELEEADPLTDGEVFDFETHVSASGSYSPGTSDYFDRSFGNWLPGDPEEIEVESVKFGDLEIIEHAPEHVFEQVDEDLLAVGRDGDSDDGDGDYDAAADL